MLTSSATRTFAAAAVETMHRAGAVDRRVRGLHPTAATESRCFQAVRFTVTMATGEPFQAESSVRTRFLPRRPTRLRLRASVEDAASTRDSGAAAAFFRRWAARSMHSSRTRRWSTAAAGRRCGECPINSAHPLNTAAAAARVGSRRRRSGTEKEAGAARVPPCVRAKARTCATHFLRPGQLGSSGQRVNKARCFQHKVTAAPAPRAPQRQRLRCTPPLCHCRSHHRSIPQATTRNTSSTNHSKVTITIWILTQ